MVVVVAKNKGSRREIEKRVGQDEGSAKVRVLDFETCTAPGFDWGFITHG